MESTAGAAPASRLAALLDLEVLDRDLFRGENEVGAEARMSLYGGQVAAQKVGASLARGLNDDVFRASLDKAGFPPLHSKSQTEMKEFIDADRARWSGVIKQLKISLD